MNSKTKRIVTIGMLCAITFLGDRSDGSYSLP